MGQNGPKSDPLQANQRTDSPVASKLERARVYLNAASPSSALEILEPILEISWRQLTDDSVRVDLLTSYLQACLSLRRTEPVKQ